MGRINAVKTLFGDAVRRARLTLGISQEELAERSGLDRSYIGSVERGQRNISIISIDRIASGLGLEISDLFKATSSGVIAPPSQGDI